nr:N-acetyltransferase [Gryllotalpicola ginsengisoli]
MLPPGVDPTASIGDRTTIHRLAQVSEHARIGSECVLHAGAFIGRNVLLGPNCVVQDEAVVQESTLVEEAVRIGRGAVLANRVSDHFDGLVVRAHAVIGAGARCVGPAQIGRWAVVAPGALVMDDVPDFAVVEGSPAHRSGWVGRAGYRLTRQRDGTWLCPKTGERYTEVDGVLVLAV